MNIIALNEFAVTWCAGVVAVLWQSCLAVLLALGVVAMARRWSAHLRYAILLLALLKLLLPPISVEIASALGHLPELPVLASPLVSNAEQTSVRIAEALPETAALIPPHVRGWKWPLILVSAHWAGIFIATMFVFGRYRRVRQIISRGEPIRDRNLIQLYEEILGTFQMKNSGGVLYSQEIATPMTAGIFRKYLLLPANVPFNLGELRIIFAHEAAHMKRNDLLVDLVQRVVQAVWWFNPLVWMLNRKICAVREECCDEILLAQKAVDPAEYCDTLLNAARKLAQSRPPLLGIGIATREHPLAERIARIMNPHAQVWRALPKTAIAFILMLGCLVLPNLKATTEQPKTIAPFDIIEHLAESWTTSPKPRLVMNDATLDGVDWQNRQLTGASLCNASLKGANLAGADLRRANLAGANLQAANLAGADLSEANLTGADLTGAILTRATLRRAWLSGAQLHRASLDDANLDWAFLRGTKTSDTTLIAPKWRMVIGLLATAQSGQDFRQADLSNANLSKLLFVNGRLDGANLTGADLSFADLHGTSFTGATMNHARLEGANLEHASLRQATLDSANLSRSPSPNLISLQLF